jgi:PAS domain S-box-containing protein
LRRALELAHVGWWQLELGNQDDIDANPLTWSDEVYRIFGHEPRAFPATNDAFFAQVHPDDRDAVRAAVQRALAGGTDYRIEHRVIRPDGAVRLVEEHASIERDQAGTPVRLIGTVMDITDRRRIVDAFHGGDAGARLLAGIVDTSHDAIITSTLDGEITTWNPAAARMFGYLAGEAVGRSVTMLAPPDRHDESRANLGLVASGDTPPPLETVRLRRDGSLIEVHVAVSPILDAAGTPIGASAIFRDITQQKRIATQVQHAQRLESVGRLAGGVAHDFNNLLMAITGYAELIRMDLPEDAPQQEDIRSLLAAAERGARLTRQLLAFGRRQVLNRAVLDVNAVLREMEGVLLPLAGADVALRIVTSPDPVTVLADRAQLEQVIVNLVANARDAMPHGGTLAIEADLVDIDAESGQAPETPTGRYVRIAVRDTGIGMDADVQSRLFEPFFTTKPRGTATGMGLATSYGIVQQTGGFITVESALNGGTTMRVLLPHVAAAPARFEAPPAVASEAAGETVLVTEDDAAVRASACAMLARLGYNVLEAETPSDALSVARTHPGTIDLLLSDIMLPEMPGTRLGELIEAIRPGIRVVYMSGYAGSADLIEDPKARHSFLQKPFTAHTLGRALRSALAH